jgi:hypothetical protein
MHMKMQVANIIIAHWVEHLQHTAELRHLR